MSGPKTSRYKLTAAQRRALIAQRERERRAGEAKAHIVHLTAKLNSAKKLPESAAEQARELAERTGGDNGYYELRKKLEAAADAEIEKLSKLKKEKNPDKLERAVSDARKSLEEISRLHGALDGIAVQNIRQLRENIMDSVDEAFGADFSKIMTPAQKQLRQDKLELSERLCEISSMELSEGLRKDIADAEKKLAQIDNADFLHNFSSMTVAALEKECRSYSELRSQYGAEYDRLLAEYQALCAQAGTEPEGVPFGRSAVERLSVLISETEAKLADSDEQSYISRCIDEVMEDMGYRLIGNRSVVKKSGAQFRNELYSFAEGTAVNVTYSSNGNITMELGGTDMTDRIPDPSETDRLTEDMRSFCGRFKEFERRLQEKGIVSEHISLLPPEAEYAQIINLSDYEMTENYERFSAENTGETALKEMTADE
ncbi:MAG: hypothetical protein J6A19_05340 [Oscillospiraceae bacterium]|nr:hypothetical protein [Oscillospiraceae bacterium]